MSAVCLEDPRGRCLPFDQNHPCVIGRKKIDVTLCIKNAKISRKHAVIAWKSHRWVITDHSRASSTVAGVIINGNRVQKNVDIKLIFGDKVQFPPDSVEYCFQKFGGAKRPEPETARTSETSLPCKKKRRIVPTSVVTKPTANSASELEWAAPAHTVNNTAPQSATVPQMAESTRIQPRESTSVDAFGAQTMQKIPKVKPEQLADMGLNAQEQRVFERVAARLALIQTNKTKVAATIPVDIPAAAAVPSVEEAMAEEGVECPSCLDDSVDLIRSGCACGVRFCESCTLMQVSTYARKGEVPTCLSECGQKMRRSELLRLQDRLTELGICCLCTSGPRSCSTVLTSGLTDKLPPMTEMECAMDHSFCRECLRAHVRREIENRKEPRCPRSAECRYKMDKHTIERLWADDLPLLQKYHDMRVELVKADHMFKRLCPTCDAEMSIPAHAVDASAAAEALECEACHAVWCTSCWMPHHYSCSCDEAGAIVSAWNAFVQSHQKLCGKQMRAALAAFETMAKDEEWKAQNVRHCPHCNLQQVRVSGCSSMSCGQDARDKWENGRPKSFYSKGCKRHFNWHIAAKYIPRAAFRAPALPKQLQGQVFTTGIHNPPRICVECDGHAVGTVFECIHCDPKRIAEKKQKMKKCQREYDLRAFIFKFHGRRMAVNSKTKEFFQEAMAEESEMTLRPVSLCWTCMQRTMGNPGSRHKGHSFRIVQPPQHAQAASKASSAPDIMTCLPSQLRLVVENGRKFPLRTDQIKAVQDMRSGRDQTRILRHPGNPSQLLYRTNSSGAFLTLVCEPLSVMTCPVSQLRLQVESGKRFPLRKHQIKAVMALRAGMKQTLVRRHATNPSWLLCRAVRTGSVMKIIWEGDPNRVGDDAGAMFAMKASCRRGCRCHNLSTVHQAMYRHTDEPLDRSQSIAIEFHDDGTGSSVSGSDSDDASGTPESSPAPDSPPGYPPAAPMATFAPRLVAVRVPNPFGVTNAHPAATNPHRLPPTPLPPTPIPHTLRMRMPPMSVARAAPTPTSIVVVRTTPSMVRTPSMAPTASAIVRTPSMVPTASAIVRRPSMVPTASAMVRTPSMLPTQSMIPTPASMVPTPTVVRTPAMVSTPTVVSAPSMVRTTPTMVPTMVPPPIRSPMAPVPNTPSVLRRSMPVPFSMVTAPPPVAVASSAAALASSTALASQLPQHIRSARTNTHVQQQPTGWLCSRCTLVNPISVDPCPVCHQPKSAMVAFVSQINRVRVAHVAPLQPGWWFFHLRWRPFQPHTQMNLSAAFQRQLNHAQFIFGGFRYIVTFNRHTMVHSQQNMTTNVSRRVVFVRPN